MTAPYRFTWNTVSDTASIVAASHGIDATLSGAAGALLREIDLEGPVGFARVRERFPGFATTALESEWVTADGFLNGPMRVVDRNPHLKRVQIELSVKCNFSCTYCYSESGPQQTSSLTTSDVLAMLDTADRMGVTTVDLTGGEVLIYKGWKEILEHARTLGLITSLHSNGLLLTERNVAFIAEQQVRQLQVTVESHHDWVHEAVGRGPRGSHHKVIEGIRRAKEAGINVRVAALVHRKNIDHIRESVKWFHDELGVSIYLDRVIATGGQGATDLSVTESEFWEAISPLLGLGAEAARICDSSGPVDSPGEVEPECGVAASFVYVTAEGYYSLCPTMTHREEAQFAGPVVASDTLETAWYDSPLFNRFRGLNCENTHVCPAAAMCGGGCRSNAYLATGNLTAPDVISCNIHKNPGRTFVNFLGRYEEGKFASLVGTNG